MRLYLLRHAEARKAPGQRDDDLYSLLDEGLSERGRAQAEAAARHLARAPLEAVYCSGAKRAQETAAIVGAPHGLAPTVSRDLRELSFRGELASYDEVQARIVAFALALHQGEDPLLPDGKSYHEHKRRFAAAVEAACAPHACCAIVAHGIANRSFLASALDMPDAALFRLEQDHAGINELEGAPGSGWIVRRLNLVT